MDIDFILCGPVPYFDCFLLLYYKQINIYILYNKLKVLKIIYAKKPIWLCCSWRSNHFLLIFSQ